MQKERILHLRESIRAMLTRGLLFPPSKKIIARHGTGARCAFCSEAIGATEVEYEGHAEGIVRSHPSCFQIWKEEAEGLRSPSANDQ
jgi:hypothetical protein